MNFISIGYNYNWCLLLPKFVSFLTQVPIWIHAAHWLILAIFIQYKQQCALNYITTIVLIHKTILWAKTIYFAAMGKRRQRSKKSIPRSVCCLWLHPYWTLAFPDHWGFSVFTLSPVSAASATQPVCPQGSRHRRSGGSSLGWQSEHPRSKPNIVT